MSSLIKTQCPACHTRFSLAPAQLNTADAKARCGNCQQTFLVNEHLIDIADEPLTKAASGHRPAVTNIQKTVNQHNDFLSSDTLIDDDIPSTEIQDNHAEDHSLAELDAWLLQPNSTSVENILQNARSKSHSSKITTQMASKAAHTTASKAETVTNHASENDKRSVGRSTNIESVSDTDLSQLLTDMGMPKPDESKALNSKQSSSHYASNAAVQAQTQNPAALLLWLSGCLVLVMLLFAQYVIFNLETLIKNPEHAARLQAVCAVAACSLPSADLAALNISNLKVEPSNIKAANAFSDIEAWLVNQSVQPQLLPSLKVSIYGTDSLIGEFIAMPGDYLASPQNLLTAEQIKPLMFTIPITHEQISKITIDPIY